MRNPNLTWGDRFAIAFMLLCLLGLSIVVGAVLSDFMSRSTHMYDQGVQEERELYAN